MKRKLYTFSSSEQNFLNSGDDEFLSLNFQKALEIYSQAIELYPESYLAHECLGVTQMKLGLLDQAKRSFKCAIELNINYSSAHNNLGMVYFLQEKFDLSEFHIKKALVLEPNNVEFSNNFTLCQKAIDIMNP